MVVFVKERPTLGTLTVLCHLNYLFETTHSNKNGSGLRRKRTEKERKFRSENKTSNLK
jgi:hypothetical protein